MCLRVVVRARMHRDKSSNCRVIEDKSSTWRVIDIDKGGTARVRGGLDGRISVDTRGDPISLFKVRSRQSRRLRNVRPDVRRGHQF